MRARRGAHHRTLVSHRIGTVCLLTAAGYGERMPAETNTISAHLFIRPRTQRLVYAELLQRIASLVEAGVLQAGDHIWANLDIPTGIWALTDVSTYIQVVDTPRAGWARIGKSSVRWSRAHRDTAGARQIFSVDNDLPIKPAQYDTYTVCFRNADPKALRGQFDGGTHKASGMHFDFATGSMRVIDLKVSGAAAQRPPHPDPVDFARWHSGLRGLDLLSATTGPGFHEVLRNNESVFTVPIQLDDIAHVQVLHGQIANVADTWVQPVIEGMARLGAIGDFAEDEIVDTSTS